MRLVLNNNVFEYIESGKCILLDEFVGQPDDLGGDLHINVHKMRMLYSFNFDKSRLSRLICEYSIGERVLLFTLFIFGNRCYVKILGDFGSSMDYRVRGVSISSSSLMLQIPVRMIYYVMDIYSRQDFYELMTAFCDIFGCEINQILGYDGRIANSWQVSIRRWF